AARHIEHGKTADIGTVIIQFDAATHAAGVGLAQAGIGTDLAGGDALDQHMHERVGPFVLHGDVVSRERTRTGPRVRASALRWEAWNALPAARHPRPANARAPRTGPCCTICVPTPSMRTPLLSLVVLCTIVFSACSTN